MAVLTACPGCGQQHDDPPRFCGSCGTGLTVDRGVESAEPSLVVAASDPATAALRDDSAATKPLVHARLWSDGEPLPEQQPATRPMTPVTGPTRRVTVPPPPPKRSDRGTMIALTGVACLILIVLGAALYVGGVFNDSGGGSAPNTSPVSQSAAPSATPGSNTSSAPAATSPPTTSTAASPPAAPSPPGPAQVIRTHLQDLGSGNYAGAFKLMTSAYRSQNPAWPSDRSAADPGINIISVGSPQHGSGSADIPVDFFAKDRNPTPGSDTLCREFQGTAHLVRQGSSWRYDPSGDSLNATVSPGNSNCPT